MCQADCAVVAALSRPRPQAAQAPRPSARAAAAWAAKWELAVPLVAIGSLVSGLATPTESAALTAAYAVLTQALAHRELGWRLLGRCLADCAMPIGGVMLILGMALALANYLVDTGVPDAAATWVQGAIPNKYVFLLPLCLFLFAAAALMEIYAALVVLVPLLLPLAQAYGIHPLHFGIIFLAAMGGFPVPAGGTEHLLRLGDVQQEQPLRGAFGAACPGRHLRGHAAYRTAAGAVHGPAATGAGDGAARLEVLAVGRALLVDAVFPAQLPAPRRDGRRSRLSDSLRIAQSFNAGEC